MDEETLPPPLKEALQVLRKARMPEAKVEVVVGNFAYVWLPDVVYDPTKYPAPHRRGLWARVPIQFPLINPHGIVTRGQLNPVSSHPIKGESQDPSMCAPVQQLGGTHYYSWTWSGELGEGPKLNAPSDILGVVSWIERRIRNA